MYFHAVEVDKVALNRDDDKQIVKKDGISMWSLLIMLELLTQVYIAKLESCKRFVTKLNEFHNLLDTPFSVPNKCACSVLVAS